MFPTSSDEEDHTDETTYVEDRLPYASRELVLHLKQRAEWRDRTPPREWTMDQVQRNIGAVEVIRYLEELHANAGGL